MAQDGVDEVLTFVNGWVARHMSEPNFQADAVRPQEFVPYDQISPQLIRYRHRPRQPMRYLERPLHFQSVEIINHRRYFFQLEKRPLDLVGCKLTVTCLLHVNQQDTIVHNGICNSQVGFYRFVLEFPEDCEYLISLKITL